MKSFKFSGTIQKSFNMDFLRSAQATPTALESYKLSSAIGVAWAAPKFIGEFLIFQKHANPIAVQSL